MLEDLQDQLNPHEFFLVNRQVIARIGSLASLAMHFNGKLKLHLKPALEREGIVSRDRVAMLKKLLNQ